MLASSIPAKIPLPFANSGTKNTIPTASQISVTPGAASLTDGFPPLTFTPVASGGIPPFGADFNGILYEITAIQQWQSAGGIFVYDSAFSTAIGGYPKGAILQSSDGSTEWLNLADNNTTNPDATDGSAANWVSLASYGLATVSGLTSSNVTLTPAQYGKHIIVLSGTLAGSINIVFPTSQRQWQIVNNCTMGSYTITAKTASGSGVSLVSGTQGIWGDGTNIYSSYAPANVTPSFQQITPSVAGNALTLSFVPNAPVSFRNATLTNGTPTTLNVSAIGNLLITVPSGATLGSVNAQTTRYAWGLAYNGGAPVLIIGNINGLNTDTSTLISPITISSGATSAGIWYSASTVSANSPFEILGFVDSTQTNAGTYATVPNVVPGDVAHIGAMQSLGYGQSWKSITGSRALATTYYNVTSRPIMVSTTTSSSTLTAAAAILVNGISVAQSAQASSGYTFLSGIVPPGASYILNQSGSSPALENWSELS